MNKAKLQRKRRNWDVVRCQTGKKRTSGGRSQHENGSREAFYLAEISPFATLRPSRNLRCRSSRCLSVLKDFKLDSSGHLPSGTGWGKDRGGGYPPHAATDVLAPVGTLILAVDWGTIIEFTRTGFYAGTGSIGIRHPEFVARYAEINPAKALSEGTLVQQGQIIGEVAQANNEKKTHKLLPDVRRQRSPPT